MLRHTVAARERLLGPEDPGTLAARADLAAMTRNRKRRPTAYNPSR